MRHTASLYDQTLYGATVWSLQFVALYRGLSILYICYILCIHSFIHSVACLTTGPKPLPKRALHIVLSRASSFKWEYPVLSLRSCSNFPRLNPRLSVTSMYYIFIYHILNIIYCILLCRSQRPRDLRRRPRAARVLKLWVRIPPEAWIFDFCECCMLSGRGLCEELITRPEESYRVWCVVECDLETTVMRRS
jgi:hypothetical protein